MKITECISSAFSGVYSHKMRSVLTMLGIIIGISSVIMITGLGGGVKNAVFGLIESMNTQVIQVYCGYGTWDNMLTFDDGEALEEISNIESLSYMSSWWGMTLKLRQEGQTSTGSLIGTDQNMGIIEKYDIGYGRFISKNDVESRSRVAVIKAKDAFDIFGRIDCVGEKVAVETYYGTEEFTVIGVLKPEEEDGLSQMINTTLSSAIAIIPITTLNDVFYYEDKVDFFGVTLKDYSKASDTSGAITNLLEVRHGTSDIYYAESIENELKEIDMVLSGITAFVALVAGISLFVGGVGVMNIMLVTVKERTREIGIRKSLGATRSVIKFQFMLEAVILTLVGGIIGLILGILGARGLADLISSSLNTSVGAVISINIIGMAVGISCLVGVIFGVYPAGKAAKLDPVDALRYE